MSTDLYAYVPFVSRELTPQIIRRLADFGLECELHPDYALFDDNGFLPIRMKIVSGEPPEQLKGKDLITGFECGVGDYDYQSELVQLKRGQKAGFFQKLLGMGSDTPSSPSRAYIASKEVDEVLKQCKKTVEINSQSESEMLIGISFAAVLAELTNGIVYDPQSGKYMEPANVLAQIPDQIRSGGAGDCESFTGWSE